MTRTPNTTSTDPDTAAWRVWLVRHQALVVAVLLVAFFLQAALATRLMSTTVDEFAHLPAGYIYWDNGDFSVYRRNPPLIKMWAVLPLFRSSLDKEFTDYSNLWSAGYAFMLRNQSMYHMLYVRCRLMIVVLATALGALVFRWSRELFGVAGGVLSLAIYALSPNIIGHAGLVTSDVAAAGMYALACYALYKLDERWSAWRLAFVGLAFGLAAITKFSCLPLLPLAPLVLVLAALVPRRDASPSRPPWKQTLGRASATLGVIAVGCLVIVNAGYGFSHSFKPWSSYRDEVEPFATLGSSWIAQTPAPFPEQFLRGLSEQKRASAEPQFTYLHGAITQEASWYYPAVVFLLKTPLPTLALVGLALYAGLRRSHAGFRRLDLVFVAMPAIFFVVLLSTKLLRLRWQLPIFPLMFVACGALVRDNAPRTMRRPAWLLGVAALVVWLAVESAITFPHYIAYFNEITRGHGERFLVDSNCDWSQDHLTLRRFMRRSGIERVHLATLGRVDPKFYGVQYETLRPNEPVAGDVVISVALLAGNPYWTPDNGRTAIQLPPDGYAWLREHKPVRRIGGSLYYFRIEPSDAGEGTAEDKHAND